jgi:hypothetical protein
MVTPFSHPDLLLQETLPGLKFRGPPYTDVLGEISLFEFDQKEDEEAKARLEAKRAKRRERYAKNRDQINAKRRKEHARKKRQKQKEDHGKNTY